MDAIDIAVIGGGPAGCLAAIRAAKSGKVVVLIEHNGFIGKKLLLTGKGRCNVTNTASLDVFLQKFGSQGPFLRQAFTIFSNQDLIEFFRKEGLEVKIERQGRVFPVTERADSVTGVLIRCLKKNKVNIFYRSQVLNLNKEDGFFSLILSAGRMIKAEKVILATGGMSYQATGSRGSGFLIAKRLGHCINPLLPGLVPLTTQEKWVKELQGLVLKNVRIRFIGGKKKIISEIGELLFTHFGVSGPLILDLSSQITAWLEDKVRVKLLVDLKPGLSLEQLEDRLRRDFGLPGKMMIKNLFKRILPQRMITVFLRIAEINGQKKNNEIRQQERRRIIELLKSFQLSISGALSLDKAMVTAGGVSTGEINPRTMESRLVPGLYFAGEIIAGAAPSGGYNLQQAFSTGYLAGEKAGES